MIPQRDIRIWQQKAFQLYFNGQGQDEVKQMLREAGGDDQEIESLAVKFANDFKFYQQEKNRVARKNAPLDKIVGGILLFGSILITAISYVVSDHVYFIWWGAMFTGVVILGRAIIAENQQK